MQEVSFCVEREDVGLRLDIYLLSNLEKKDFVFSRRFIQDLILKGNVTVNNKTIEKSHYKVKLNDEILINIPPRKEFEIEPENIPIEIIYEDSDILVVNKPAGMVVHPAPGNLSRTLVNALLFHCKDLSRINPLRPGIVHRLDKDASGLLVVAKTDFSHIQLSEQFSQRKVKRHYIALVRGKMEFDEGIIDLPIGRHSRDRKKMAVRFFKARESKTSYKTLKRWNKFSLLELIPETGRTHQIRVHLSSIGHPILGDKIYGKDTTFSRLALHAYKIKFCHPRTKEVLEFVSNLPKDFVEFMVKE
jgi:23S rRNA pseudouridine1911/1915/1917 synthase